jgi:hypothetical protein
MYAALNEGRLPILLGGDHSLGVGSISAVARHCRERGKKLAGVVARCPRRLQHRHADTQRQCAWHAGGLPVRHRAAGAGGSRRRRAGAAPGEIRQIGIRSVDAGEKRLVHDMASTSSTCATSTRWACAGDGRSVGAGRCQHAPARQLRRRFPGPGDRARCRHHRARRAELPRSAAVHGNDRRHRPARLARHGRAQSCAGRSATAPPNWRSI